MTYLEFKEIAKKETKIIKLKDDIAFYYSINLNKLLIYDFLYATIYFRNCKKDKFGKFIYNKKNYYLLSTKNKEVKL